MSENEDFASEELDSDIVASDLSSIDEDIDEQDEVEAEEADFESDDDEDFEDDDDDDTDESDEDSDGEFDDDDEDAADEDDAQQDLSASASGAQVLSGPVFALESLPVTGEARVDDALGRLGDLEGLPVSDHPGVFEDVQRRLHDTLADLAGS